MTLHKSGNLGELNHNHLTTFGRKVMKRHLKIIGPFESTISKIKLFILSGIIAFNYNCEDASTADNNNSSNLLFIASEGNFGQNNGSISVFNEDENQFEQYLKIVQTANEAGFHTLDDIADYCLTSDITMANGNNYQKSTY